jgi:hypothetical protein
LDCITEDNAHIVATLPVTPKMPAHHPHTKVEFVLGYSITMDVPFKFARAVDFVPDPKVFPLFSTLCLSFLFSTVLVRF